jgi:hypothetical protein
VRTVVDDERFYRRLLVVVSLLMAVLTVVAGVGAYCLIWAVSTNPQWGWPDKAAVLAMAAVMVTLMVGIGWFSYEVHHL